MYRESDLRIFIFVSTVTNIMMLAALGLILAYHFYAAKLLYRNLALIFLMLSWFFQMQLFMQKVEILEKRVTSLMSKGTSRGKTEAGTGNIALAIYVFFFWLTFLIIVAAYMPASWWRSHFTF